MGTGGCRDALECGFDRSPRTHDLVDGVLSEAEALHLVQKQLLERTPSRLREQTAEEAEALYDDQVKTWGCPFEWLMPANWRSAWEESQN